MAVNRKCICCGKKFEYCPNCGGENLPWKRVYDSKECMEIAHALIASRGANGISKAETKKAMEKYPETLEKIFKYNSLTANSIKELFGIKEEKEEEPQVDVVAEAAPAVETEPAPVEEKKEQVEVPAENPEPKKAEFKSGYKGNKNYKK